MTKWAAVAVANAIFKMVELTPLLGVYGTGETGNQSSRVRKDAGNGLSTGGNHSSVSISAEINSQERVHQKSLKYRVAADQATLKMDDNGIIFSGEGILP